MAITPDIRLSTFDFRRFITYNILVELQSKQVCAASASSSSDSRSDTSLADDMSSTSQYNTITQYLRYMLSSYCTQFKALHCTEFQPLCFDDTNKTQLLNKNKKMTTQILLEPKLQSFMSWS